MSLSLAAVMALVQACAPAVAPGAMIPLVWTESAFDPLTIGVNGRPHRSLHPASTTEAVSDAQALLAQGADLDLGLSQINVHNLPALGLSVGDAFAPCRNLHAGAQVLTRDFVAARPGTVSDQVALGRALSRYNTGDSERGFKNGYVARVYHAASVIVPALSTVTPPGPSAEEGPAPILLQPTTATRPAAVPASLDVFATPSSRLILWGAAPAAASRQSSPRLTLSASGDPS